MGREGNVVLKLKSSLREAWASNDIGIPSSPIFVGCLVERGHGLKIGLWVRADTSRDERL